MSVLLSSAQKRERSDRLLKASSALGAPLWLAEREQSLDENLCQMHPRLLSLLLVRVQRKSELNKTRRRVISKP